MTKAVSDRRQLQRRARELTDIFLMRVKERHGPPREALTCMEDEAPEEFEDMRNGIVDDVVEAFEALLEKRGWRPEEQR